MDRYIALLKESPDVATIMSFLNESKSRGRIQTQTCSHMRSHGLTLSICMLCGLINRTSYVCLYSDTMSSVNTLQKRKRPQSSNSSNDSDSNPRKRRSHKSTRVASSSTSTTSTTTTPSIIDIILRIGPYVAKADLPPKSSTHSLKYDIRLQIDLDTCTSINDVLDQFWKKINPDNIHHESKLIMRPDDLLLNLYEDDTYPVSEVSQLKHGGIYQLCHHNDNVGVFVYGRPNSSSFQIAYILLEQNMSDAAIHSLLTNVFHLRKSSNKIIVVDTVNNTRVTTNLDVSKSHVCVVHNENKKRLSVATKDSTDSVL